MSERSSRPVVELTILCWLTLAVCCTASGSAAAESVESAISRSQALALHEHPDWQRLLHYYPTRLRPGLRVSHVDDPRFFLADTGKDNPAAELAASLRVLLHTPSPANDHPRCRFVAREQWLRAKLQLPAEAVPNGCTDYHDWRERLAVDSVSLIFPAAFLNNPSSMFGHTLLRFDAADVEEDSEWLSWSLNFAAEVGADSEGTFGYALKGIAGGYPGKFSVLPYYQKIQAYGAIENRDIWEYRLNLQPDEVDRLVRHVWELRDIRFDYFFFRQNCSFRLLELLEFARPGLSLVEQFPVTAIPASTVKAAHAAGLVADTAYRPATGTLAAHRLTALPDTHRAMAEQIAAEPERDASNDFLALPALQQQQIVSTANQLLTWQSRQRAMTPAMKSRRFAMLQRLARLPAYEPPPVPAPPPPDQAHGTRRISLGVGEQDDQSVTELGFRISYHDLLDRIDGYPRGAAIRLGDLRLQNRDGHARVESFAVAALSSLALQDRALGTLAWEIDVGFDRTPFLQADRLGGSARGDVGQSMGLSDSLGVYATVGASARAYTGVRTDRFLINAHAQLGVLTDNRLGTLQVEVSADAWQTQSLASAVSVSQNVVLSRQRALRLDLLHTRFQDNSDNLARLALLFYF